MPNLFSGPYAKCQCCNKITPIRLMSVAGPVSVKEVKVSHDLINRVFRDVSTTVHGDVRTRKVRDASNPLGVRQSYTYHRFGCKQCFTKSKVLFWVEASPNNWVGCWCKYCLHKHFEDGTFGHPEEGGDLGMSIIALSASISTANLISAWHEEYQRIRGEMCDLPQPLPAALEEQLF